MIEPDTAAIRANFGTRSPVDRVVLTLCDALDAARAALGLSINALVVARAELSARPHDACLALLADAVARAEAAESDLVKKSGLLRQAYSDLFAMAARAEAAEARIAAALELCDIYAGNETLAYYMPEIRRALTEGTTP